MGAARGARLGSCAAAAVLVATGCSGADDAAPPSSPEATSAVSDSADAASPEAGTSAPPTTALPTEPLRGDSVLPLALLLVPADAEEVAFTDVAAVKKRLGYADVTGQGPAFERFEFWERARVDGVMLTGTRLYGYSSLMSLDYGWTAEDVAWEVAWSSDAEACSNPEECPEGGYVLGLRRDLDWNVVVNSLADNGFAESEGSPGLFETENASAPFDEVRVVPEIHGLAVGDAALPDESGDVPESMSTELGSLANRLGTPESAYLRPSCVPLETALGPDVSQDDLTDYFKHNDPSRLQPLTGTALGLHGSRAVAVLQYAAPGAAAEDIRQRVPIVQNWSSLQTGEPFSSVGDAVGRTTAGRGFVDIDVDDMSLLARMVLTDDAPWALCPAHPPPK